MIGVQPIICLIGKFSDVKLKQSWNSIFVLRQTIEIDITVSIL